MKVEATGYGRQAAWPVTEGDAVGKAANAQTEEAKKGRWDSFVPTEKLDGAQKVWKEICSSHPGIQFMLYEGEVDPAAVEQLVRECGKGGFIVLSRDFLDWMSEGEKSWQQGMGMIADAKAQINRSLLAGTDGAGVVLAANGESLEWTMEMPALAKEPGVFGGKENGADGQDSLMSKEERELEGVRKMLEKMNEAKKEPLIKIKKRINYSMGRDMSKLCRASQDRSIRSFISGVYARRAQIGSNRSYDKKERSAAVAQMDYVIRCARTKIRQVKEEGEMKARAEKLRKAKEEKKRLQVERELKDRQIKRRAKEHARIFAELPDLPGLRNREEQREAVQQFNQIAQAAGVSGAGEAAAGAAAAPGIATMAGSATGAAQTAAETVCVQTFGM